MRGTLDWQDPEHVSNVACGPDNQPSPGRPADAVAGRRRRRADALTTALLALANFVGLTVVLLHLVSRYQHAHNDVGANVNFFLGSDLVMPFAGWTWFLIVLNGAALGCRQRTRALGLGLLAAATAIAVPIVGWGFFTLVTY
jgi:hypothetical protein